MVFQRPYSRRAFLKRSALAAAGTAVASVATTTGVFAESSSGYAPVAPELEEVSIADLQAAMEAGSMTSRQITGMYLDRIAAYDHAGPSLRSVLQVNPDAVHIAQQMDDERAAGTVRGPLHGIPVLIKANIDTGDAMETTAGSWALAGTTAPQDATVAARLRAAGAVILGKTNLSEWANFRSFHSSSGWSGQGRQCKNPYILTHNPCGSSSGSGTAPSANLCVVALGTETDGSIVCPSTTCGLVGIKPTVGLVSRAGVIPISHSQDTVGPMARTVADAAATLGALVGVDPRDEATDASDGNFQTDYTQYLDANALNGARIGVARAGLTGYSEETDNVFNQAVGWLQELGATIVDPADIPTIDEISTSPAEITVLTYEFKHDMAAYLATRTDQSHRSLDDLIAFNEANADIELPYFGQEWFYVSTAQGPLTDPAYLEAAATARRIGGPDGIDAVLAQHDLDALVAPTGHPSWPIDLINGDHFLGASSSPAAIAGYPLVTVPAGYVWGLPVGITFMGSAWSEPALIALAYAFEQGTLVRQKPAFLPGLELA
jgi:amidase